MTPSSIELAADLSSLAVLYQLPLLDMYLISSVAIPVYLLPSHYIPKPTCCICIHPFSATRKARGQESGGEQRREVPRAQTSLSVMRDLHRFTTSEDISLPLD